ncbi:hypothetical protein PRIPAC_78334 [Pristionchus pacificus]|uniref:Uncharacterized protein n=1 Tax=Pristionchus pacificus TaxID=54126 RepID=A0A2A6CP27_PRIPA|nr:hypothetical protein PRIPAC_78334 [Pristionchus pacificus]|eukprot:PDM79952.1 hypothetical protein PRIPAC_32531 [Pristionchus pacificus]
MHPSYLPISMGDYTIYLAAAVKSGFADWYLAQPFCAGLELIINAIALALYVRSSMLMKKVKVTKKNRKLLIFGCAVFAVNVPGLTLQVARTLE